MLHFNFIKEIKLFVRIGNLKKNMFILNPAFRSQLKSY
jgi:hypothetical protein